jgi:hypothetical protein
MDDTSSHKSQRSDFDLATVLINCIVYMLAFVFMTVAFVFTAVLSSAVFAQPIIGIILAWLLYLDAKSRFTIDTQKKQIVGLAVCGILGLAFGYLSIYQMPKFVLTGALIFWFTTSKWVIKQSRDILEA